LDDENEGQILANLKAADIAVVLSTHRVHKQFCDQRVYWLQQGQLVEESEAQWTSSEDELPEYLTHSSEFAYTATKR
jgi:ABC-type bacteriocin/lantibiotic exporter with double-glycine peptidase domain